MGSGVLRRKVRKLNRFNLQAKSMEKSFEQAEVGLDGDARLGMRSFSLVLSRKSEMTPRPAGSIHLVTVSSVLKFPLRQRPSSGCPGYRTGGKPLNEGGKASTLSAL